MMKTIDHFIFNQIKVGKLIDVSSRARSMLDVEFEHAERLGLAIKRQREIENELDLNKDDSGAEGLSEETI